MMFYLQAHCQHALGEQMGVVLTLSPKSFLKHVLKTFGLIPLNEISKINGGPPVDFRSWLNMAHMPTNFYSFTSKGLWGLLRSLFQRALWTVLPHPQERSHVLGKAVIHLVKFVTDYMGSSIKAIFIVICYPDLLYSHIS